MADKDRENLERLRAAAEPFANLARRAVREQLTEIAIRLERRTPGWNSSYELVRRDEVIPVEAWRNLLAALEKAHA